MWPRKPEVLSPLDLTLPAIPSRSRLFALRPAGLGTGHVEGLASYITRLARAHSVNPRRLIREEFVKAHPDPEQLRFVARRADCVGTLDGLGRYAETFVSLTAELTTLPAVRYLTLLPLAKLLPHNGAGLLARQPRWCPTCLSEMIHSGEEVTRPLVWSLDLYRVCHRHRQPLAATCVCCGKAQSFVPIYPDLAHCVHCRGPLGGRQPAASEVSVTGMDVWVAESLADLAARLPDLDGIADRECFIAFLQTAIAEQTGGNRTAFCKRLGLLPWTVKNWLTRGERPSLPQIVAIGYGLGVRVSEMFLPRSEQPAQILQSLPAKIRERAARPQLDGAERLRLVRAITSAANDSADTRSLAELARTLGFTRSCLKYWFPDECAAIRRKHLRACRLIAAARRDTDHQRVANAVKAVAWRGEFPSTRKVSEILNRQGLMLLRPDLTEVYRLTVKEAVGCQPKLTP